MQGIFQFFLSGYGSGIRPGFRTPVLQFFQKVLAYSGQTPYLGTRKQNEREMYLSNNWWWRSYFLPES